MPIGPGKYDKECVNILEEEEADMVMVIVFGGKRGGGFSSAARGLMGVAGVLAAPDTLRAVADSIDIDMKNIPKHDA